MDIFTAIAEPTRRNIIEMLASNGELSATDISGKFHSSPPAISQHLKVLREAKLVRMEKRSRQRIYTINPPAMKELEQWAKQKTALWDRRLDRLDKVLQAKKLKNEMKHGTY
ncbi:MAG TPA: metalloregulator ArsR/SmtB family transcription factor [Candidatus Paceibacterota bacterium]